MRLLRIYSGLGPSLLLLGIFALYPFLEVVRFSTWKWSGLSAPTPVGLANYKILLSSPDFGYSLRITLLFAVAVLPLFIGLSVLTALALHRQRYERAAKGLLFMPSLITVGAAAVAWYTLLAPGYGALATVLPIPNWNNSPFWAFVIVVLFTLWRYLGYGVLVVSAHLKTIPESLLEAAQIDGAHPWQVTRFVILPMLKPAVAFLSVVGSILALQSYVAVYLLTRGGPYGSTQVLGYYLYKIGFEQFRLGYAAAITVVLLVITLVVAGLQAQLLAGVEA